MVVDQNVINDNYEIWPSKNMSFLLIKLHELSKNVDTQKNKAIRYPSIECGLINSQWRRSVTEIANEHASSNSKQYLPYVYLSWRSSRIIFGVSMRITKSTLRTFVMFVIHFLCNSTNATNSTGDKQFSTFLRVQVRVQGECSGYMSVASPAGKVAMYFGDKIWIDEGPRRVHWFVSIFGT